MAKRRYKIFALTWNLGAKIAGGQERQTISSIPSVVPLGFSLYLSIDLCSCK